MVDERHEAELDFLRRECERLRKENAELRAKLDSSAERKVFGWRTVVDAGWHAVRATTNPHTPTIETRFPIGGPTNPVPLSRGRDRIFSPAILSESARVP
jgi:hypothetical protein